jgi:hypothetical protein
MLKKSLFLAFAFILIGLAAAPQMQAQTQQQRQELEKLQADLLAEKIDYYEYLRRASEVMNPKPPEASYPPQLIGPPGKAWVIQDNQVQGSGEAIVFKADGGFEGYNRKLGVWRPSMDNSYSTTTYTATGDMIWIKSDSDYYTNYVGNYTYTITGGGSTLTITRTSNDGRGSSGAAGAYTLRDMPRVQAAGGSIVNPAGTAWDVGNRGRSHDIYNADGIRYCFGGSGAGPWDFTLEIWNTYTVNSSTGSVILYYHDNRQNKPEDFNYSVTDFGSGNKTLRTWRVDKMFPHDEVYRLVPTPSGFRLPKVR